MEGVAKVGLLAACLGLGVAIAGAGAGACTVITTSADGGADAATDAASTTDGSSPPDGGVSAAFTLPCGDATQETTFPAQKGEVIRFDAVWNGRGFPSAAIIEPSGSELSVRGNPLDLGVSNLEADKPTTVTRVFEPLTTGTYKVRLRNTPPACDVVTVRLTRTVAAAAMPNLTSASATALTKGQGQKGHLGCGNERWYRIQAAAGEQLSVDFSASLYPGEIPGIMAPFTVSLHDTSGAPIQESGNDVDADGDLPGNAIKLPYTSQSAAAYLVRIRQRGCIEVISYGITY